MQEFRVFRHQFDAQYGNALNAVVSVVTRAGSNQLQGSAFYFGRDDTLNARNAFAQRKPPLTNSGPVSPLAVRSPRIGRICLVPTNTTLRRNRGRPCAALAAARST